MMMSTSQGYGIDYKDTLPLRVQGEDFSVPLSNDSTKDDDDDVLIIPWVTTHRVWNKIFLASCVIGVIIDPLFLYIPIVDDDEKCLHIDQNMKNISLVLRIITDFSYILHVIFRLRSALKYSKTHQVSILIGFPWSYLLINVLSILPIPQVIILVYFSRITGSKSLTSRKFLNLLLLLQYVPRLLRVYLSAKELGRTDSLTRRVWVRCTFFFFLYIIFGHVFGAFWYFYSIFRETACWHHACKAVGGPECITGPFDCRGNHPIKNLTILNQYCPINPPNRAIFDFGIFSQAIESRIVSNTDFLKKFSRTFWWGLKNLSSFGQNLDTSSNVSENLFAVLISILGILIFLYLIGNIQTYIQMETTKNEEKKKKIHIKLQLIESCLNDHQISKEKKASVKRYVQSIIKDDEKGLNQKHLSYLLQLLDEKKNQIIYETIRDCIMVKHVKNTIKQDAEKWIEDNWIGIPKELNEKIMSYAQLRLEEGNVGCESIMFILPTILQAKLKEHLCLPILEKVPLFNMFKHDYDKILSVMKPMTFAQGSYIFREGEPLDMMLFITQGVVRTFGIRSNTVAIKCGNYFGNELIVWQANPSTSKLFPISTVNLKCHTKVEAFVLMANDIEKLEFEEKRSKIASMLR